MDGMDDGKRMKQFRGTIKNWKQVASQTKGKTIIIGEPCEDNPFYSHDYMHTSIVVSINEDRTKVETLNSIYKLQDEKKCV